MKGWLDKYQEGGEVFLQPNSKKLPKGYKVPLKNESSELAMSIGGEQGEPAYLIPSFKYGKPLLNPLEEYRETGEHLGGPFKTWQEADKWEREIRHPYVEKGQPIPSPLKYWGEGFKNGGVVAQGGETIPSSREIPEITVYGKKNYLQELDKQQQKYLADMAKYKKDSAVYQSYQDSLNLYTDVLDMANSEQNTYWNTRKKEIIDNYKRVAKGETVEYWKKAKAESKDADKSWYDQMIKKSIDQQKYYSNPKNIDKAIQDETKKHYNAFNIGTAYQLKTATNKNSNRYDYPDDGYFYTNMIRANNSSDREYKEYLNHFIKYRESKLKDAIKSGKSQVSVSGMASTNIPGAKSEISNAKKLKKLLSSDIKPVGYTDSPESLRYPIYKKPVAEPPIATKPIGTNVKYDPTYENLRMRPLWATMAKQDTTSKIGTLNSLDPLYEKGFTYGEAQKFPEEIRRQYKLDYPIYEDGGTIPKAQEGKTVRDFLHKAIGVPLALNQFGYDLLGGDASITEKSLTDNELTTLRKVTRNVLKEGKKTIGYDDYSKEFGKDVFEAIYNSSIKERIKDLKDPSYNLAFTLGNSAINISGNDTIINDRYNFNQRVEPKEFGKELLQGNYNIKDNPYFFIQDIGHTFGSKEGEGSPIKINISQKRNGGMIPLYAEGGSMSYTPEYIEQLKQFENRHDNLAYHLDNKKIPTIGWGHRITEEELKRKAIKMGKEWIPYEKFSGKEGRQYADRLMELDVAHHYNRLEKQVGRDTLATLPPELHDVLLDITYNRGSLGDSLEYVKKGDIPGLKNYLADVSKGLKGGAKTRMEWRANRIPLTTPAPVQVPLYDTPQNSYVPEVLQNIVQDNEGYRNPENYGKPVQIVSNQSTTPISMQGVPFPILAMSDTGELKIMMPGEEHEFEGGSVTELPMAKKGGKYQKGGEIDPVLNEVKDAYNFIKSYHYSPKFEERYRNMYANDLLYNTKHEDHFIDYYSNIIPTIQNPQFKKEYEDQLRYYQKERDESLKKLDEKVDLSVSTARNKLKDLSFFTLRGEERQPWSDRIIRSFKGRPNPEGVETGSHYNTANNIAFIYKDQSKDEYGNPGSIAAHEFSHAVSSHIPYSIDMILKQSKMLTNPRDEHDTAFDETKSDIDALRYLLNKNKIYDTRTQDFTKEHLQRAKKTIKDFSFDRLQRLYNDDDLIELMNIIAANDNDKKEPVTIAKKGVVAKSKQLRTFTGDSGWLSKYKEL